MNKQKLFDETVEYLSGSCCMGGIGSALHSVAELSREFEEDEIEVTDEMETEFELYCEKIGLRECENCGWFNYPDEDCDCED